MSKSTQNLVWLSAEWESESPKQRAPKTGKRRYTPADNRKLCVEAAHTPDVVCAPLYPRCVLLEFLFLIACWERETSRFREMETPWLDFDFRSFETETTETWSFETQTSPLDFDFRGTETPWPPCFETQTAPLDFDFRSLGAFGVPEGEHFN